MGGGQAGAPADDYHVPWSLTPRHDHRDLAGHGAGWPGSRNQSGPGPGSGPKGQQGGAGANPAKQPEAAEWLRKNGQRAATITMLRLKVKEHVKRK